MPQRPSWSPFLFEGLLDPIYQLPSKLPGVPASFFVGAALFSLLNSEKGRNRLCLVLFGLFVSFSALSRFIAAGYVFVICAPIFLGYLIDIYRREQRRVLETALSLVAVVVPLALCANLMLRFTAPNLSFYAHAGYVMGQGSGVAFRTTVVEFALKYVGATAAGICSLLCIFYFAANRPARGNMWSFAETLWAAFAHVFLLVFVLQVEGDPPQMAYALPGVLLLAVAPFVIRFTDASAPRGVTTRAGAPLLVFLATVAGWSWHDTRNSPALVYAQPHEEAEYAFTRQVAEHVVATFRGISGRRPAFDMAFFYYGRFVTAMALKEFGTLLHFR